jgi:hypothetical protein
MRSWDYRLLATLAGLSAACAGDWDQAESHFEHALQLARDLPMRLEEFDACRFYARMLISRGRPRDRARARGLLAQAVAGYAAFEMPRHAEMARAALND